MKQPQQKRIVKQPSDGLFDFSPIPMWVYDINSLQILAANKAACNDYGYTAPEFLSLTVKALWPPAEQEKMRGQIQDIVRKGLQNRTQINHVTKNGTLLHVDVTSEPLPTWSESARIVVALDITDKIKAEKIEQLFNDLYHLERDVLELNAKSDVEITKVLLFYLTGLEAIFPQITCSIMRVKNNRLHNWASPSLPTVLTDQFEGLEIGSNVGSCGTAAFLKKKVIVTDIANDRRWALYKNYTLAAGYKACWSHPILDTNSSVIATFAVYYRDAIAPEPQEEQVISRVVSLLQVILENRRFEDMLMASEKRYSDLFHLSPLPMWVYDIESLLFLDVNYAAIQTYGYSREEFLQMTIRDIRPEEDQQLLEPILNEHSMNHEGASLIVRHSTKKGDILLVNVTGTDIQFGNQQARMIVAIDNTEKIKSREELITSENRFKQLIQEGSDLITIMDKSGRFTYISPNAERLLGVAEQDLLGEIGTDFILEADRANVIARIQTLHHEKRIALPPFRIIGKNQEIRWMETVVTDLTEDKSVAGIITNARDVTRRVLSELRNKEHLDRYNTVAKATSDTIWDYNMVTGEVNWNPNIQTLFGYDQPENKYEWWRDHVHPEDVERVADLIIDKISEKESIWNSEYRFRCADGTYKYVFDRGFLLFDDDGHPLRMIGSMQDVSEIRRYIQKIEQQNERLKDIAFAQSHTVRGPLARILGLVSLLKDSANDAELMETLFNYLEKSASDLDEVVRNIISKSRL